MTASTGKELSGFNFDIFSFVSDNEWRNDRLRKQLKYDDDRLFVKEIQFHVRPDSVQVCFGYHASVFREVFVSVLVDSVAVLLGKRMARQISYGRIFGRIIITKFLKLS